MKFRIIDEDGREHTVEEVIEKETTDTEVETEVETKDEAIFSDDEIQALKSLAQSAPKLLELLAVEKEEHKENPELLDEDEEADIEDEDEEDDEVLDEDEEEMVEDEDEEEEVIDTCKGKSRDSKRSYGSIERHKKSVDDSMTDDISSAWAKRYGGKN